MQCLHVQIRSQDFIWALDQPPELQSLFRSSLRVAETQTCDYCEMSFQFSDHNEIKRKQLKYTWITSRGRYTDFFISHSSPRLGWNLRLLTVQCSHVSLLDIVSSKAFNELHISFFVIVFRKFVNSISEIFGQFWGIIKLNSRRVCTTGHFWMCEKIAPISGATFHIFIICWGWKSCPKSTKVCRNLNLRTYYWWKTSSLSFLKGLRI